MSGDSPVKRADMALPISTPPGEAAAEAAAAQAPGLTPRGKPIWALRQLPFRLFFNHVDRLVATGYVRRLEPTDLYPAEDLGMDAVRLHRRCRRAREACHARQRLPRYS